MKKLIGQNWLLFIILLLATITRFYRIYDYAEFLGDQGRDIVIVRDFLKNGNLFFIGPQTSIGNMYLGPFYYYLFVAPGLLMSQFNPIGPAIIVALLGVVTVYFVYRFSKRWFNPQTAYIASLLYAISPVVIKYTTFSWNPNIMPLFSLLFVNFLTQSRYKLAAIAFIICLNSHFLALLLLPLALLILLTKKPFPWQQLIFPTIIFLISLTPQVLFDIKHNGQNINAIIGFFTKRETTINLKPYKAIPQLVPLFNQVNTRLLASKDVNFGVFVSTLFAILITSNLIKQIKTKKYDVHFLILLSWLVIGLIGLALYKQHIYDHYFGFIYPVVFILFASTISQLRQLPLGIFVLVLVTYAIVQNPFRYSPPRQLPTTEQIDELIIANSHGQPFNFALLAKMNYDPGYRYLLSEHNAQVELLQNKITDQLFVVCEPFQIDCNPINNPEWGVAAFGWAKIDSQWEINGIKIFRLIHTQP